MPRSFRSVGTTEADAAAQQASVTSTPVRVGIVTPLTPGNNDEGLLAMSYDVGLQMKNNLRDLLMTNWGERVALYDYGADLQPLVTEYEGGGKDSFDDRAMQRISSAVQRWMPYVDLENFESVETHGLVQGIGNVVLTVTYSIPRARIPSTRLQVTFAVT